MRYAISVGRPLHYGRSELKYTYEMKTSIYILLFFAPILFSCGGNTSSKDALKEEFPSSVEIYYKYDDCPWGSTGIVWYSPKEWLDYPLSKITLVDRKSLDFFNGLRLKAESDGCLDSFPGKIWFSAIVDYKTYTDTVSISAYRVLYNDKAFEDTTAVFYYLSKIQQEDSITYNKLDRQFYYNDFQRISKEIYDKYSSQVPDVNIGLKEKIKELLK